MSHRNLRAALAGFAACGLILVAAACERNVEQAGPNVKQVTITEANRAALAEELRQTNALTGEEGELLRAYLERSVDGTLPAGKTLAEVISEQRGYESRDPAAEASGVAEEQATPSQPVQTAGAPERAAATPAAPGEDRVAPPTTAPVPDEPPSPTPVVLVVLPAGTPLTVSLGDAVSSKAASAGDGFVATLGADLEADGRVLAPQGSTLRGRVAEAAASGKVKGRARLVLALEVLEVGDAAHPIKSLPLAFEAGSNKGSDAKKVGIGAGAGAVLGAIKDGKKGALIGTVIGAGAGTAVVLLTTGDEVELPAGQQLRFELLEDVRLPPVG